MIHPAVVIRGELDPVRRFAAENKLTFLAYLIGMAIRETERIAPRSTASFHVLPPELARLGKRAERGH
jgi:hypothetical protein